MSDATEGGRRGAPSVLASSVGRRRDTLFRVAHDANQRRRPLAPIGLPASAPSATTTIEKHVLQKDFYNIVGSATGGYSEVEVTMDADGKLRFWASGSGGGGGGGSSYFPSGW